MHCFVWKLFWSLYWFYNVVQVVSMVTKRPARNGKDDAVKFAKMNLNLWRYDELLLFFIFLRVSIIKAQDKLVFNIPALACPITVDQLSLVKVRVQPGSLGFRVDDWVDRPLHFFKISNAPAKYGSCNMILFKLRRHHGSSARLL